MTQTLIPVRFPQDVLGEQLTHMIAVDDPRNLPDLKTALCGHPIPFANVQVLPVLSGVPCDQCQLQLAWREGTWPPSSCAHTFQPSVNGDWRCDKCGKTETERS